MAQTARTALQGLQQLGSRGGWSLQQTSGFTTLLSGWWQQGGVNASAAPAAALGWQRLRDLLPSQWLAAPKRKVTPHRKGKRSATKYIRFVPNVAQCSKCERVFPPHAMPSKCEDDECPAFNLRRNPQQAAAGEGDQQ